MVHWRWSWWNSNVHHRIVIGNQQIRRDAAIVDAVVLSFLLRCSQGFIMLVAAPVAYTITGLFQDLRGILGEMSAITEKPAEPFWVLYRQLARSIADQYGAGNAIGVISTPWRTRLYMKSMRTLRGS
jgi:hypothetical protein